MSFLTEPKSGLKYGWPLGFKPWKENMDENLLRIGRFGFHLSVIDRNLTVPPADPDDGDSYICAASSTLAWDDHDGEIAVWDAALEDWAFAEPGIGWLAYIEDEQVLSVHKAGGWSAGVAI